MNPTTKTKGYWKDTGTCPLCGSTFLQNNMRGGKRIFCKTCQTKKRMAANRKTTLAAYYKKLGRTPP